MPDLTPKQKARLTQFANGFFQSISTLEALRTKTDEEIAQLLLDHIWADLPVHSPQEILLDEAIRRLRGDSGDGDNG